MGENIYKSIYISYLAYAEYIKNYEYSIDMIRNDTIIYRQAKEVTETLLVKKNEFIHAK